MQDRQNPPDPHLCLPQRHRPRPVRNNLSRNNVRVGCSSRRQSRPRLELHLLARPRLDAIDRKILKELQAEPRMTNVELRAGSAFRRRLMRRVRALEEAGYIRGYRALLDEKKPRLRVAVFAMVHLAEPGRNRSDGVRGLRCARSPSARSAGCFRARSIFVLKCVAPYLKTFQAFGRKAHFRRPMCRNVKTSPRCASPKTRPWCRWKMTSRRCRQADRGGLELPSAVELVCS